MNEGSSRLAEDNRRVRENTRNHIINTISKRIVWIPLLVNICFLIADITILIVSKDISCDQNLKAFIYTMIGYKVLSTIRIIFYLIKNSENEHKNILRRLMDILSLAFMIWGIVILSKSGNCEVVAEHLYNLTLAHTIFLGLYVCAPIIFGIIFCCSIPFLLYHADRLEEYFNRGNVEGATSDEINKLKSYKFNDNKLVNENDENDKITINEEDTSCCICMEHYNEGEIIRYLGCNHNFHLECCDTWLKINKSCPLCRTKIDQTA